MKRKWQIVNSRVLNRKVTQNATTLILAERDERAKVTFTCEFNDLVENNQFLMIHLLALSTVLFFVVKHPESGRAGKKCREKSHVFP